MTDTSKRNEAIYKAAQRGESWAEIGRKFGICRERVRQIVLKQRRLAEHAEATKGATPDGPIQNYTMSARAANCLKNENIVTLRQLEEYTEAELLRVPNFGRKSLEEIVKLCKREGIQLGIRSHERWQRIRQESDNKIMMRANDDDATRARIDAALDRYNARQRERLGAPTWQERMGMVYARIHAADLLTRFVKGDPEAVMQVCETW